jgi:hypothetical protein
MRLALIVSPLLAVALACDAAPKKGKKDTAEPLDRACSVQECFSERDVRDFHVVDQTTVIVYVGSQRCAFELQLRGTFCDLTFAPELFFHSHGGLEGADERIEGRHDPRYDVFGPSRSGHASNLRICADDLGISVDGGVFTENSQTSRPVDRFGNRESECQISTIESITDDEILQIYVDHGAAPPPPMGTGEIEVGEQEDDGVKAPTEPAERAATAPEGAAVATGE